MEGKVLESWSLDDDLDILYLHFENGLEIEVRIVNTDYPDRKLGVFVMEDGR